MPTVQSVVLDPNQVARSGVTVTILLVASSSPAVVAPGYTGSGTAGKEIIGAYTTTTDATGKWTALMKSNLDGNAGAAEITTPSNTYYQITEAWAGGTYTYNVQIKNDSGAALWVKDYLYPAPTLVGTTLLASQVLSPIRKTPAVLNNVVGAETRLAQWFTSASDITWPANTLTAGQVWSGRAIGGADILNDAGARVFNFTFALKNVSGQSSYDNHLVGAGGAAAFFGVNVVQSSGSFQNNSPWWLDWELVILSTGLNGLVTCTYSFCAPWGKAVSDQIKQATTNTGGIAIDTTRDLQCGLVSTKTGGIADVIRCDEARLNFERAA